MKGFLETKTHIFNIGLMSHPGVGVEVKLQHFATEYTRCSTTLAVQKRKFRQAKNSIVSSSECAAIFLNVFLPFLCPLHFLIVAWNVNQNSKNDFVFFVEKKT